MVSMNLPWMGLCLHLLKTHFLKIRSSLPVFLTHMSPYLLPSSLTCLLPDSLPPLSLTFLLPILPLSSQPHFRPPSFIPPPSLPASSQPQQPPPSLPAFSQPHLPSLTLISLPSASLPPPSLTSSLPASPHPALSPSRTPYLLPGSSMLLWYHCWGQAFSPCRSTSKRHFLRGLPRPCIWMRPVATPPPILTHLTFPPGHHNLYYFMELSNSLPDVCLPYPLKTPRREVKKLSLFTTESPALTQTVNKGPYEEFEFYFNRKPLKSLIQEVMRSLLLSLTY